MQNVETSKLASGKTGHALTTLLYTLCITFKPILEWNSFLYVNFVDFQKAFDSLYRNLLWSLMRHYDIPEKLITIIQKLYQPSTCQVVHNGVLSELFSVDTGVRHGCLLLPLLFLMAVDWIMCKTTALAFSGHLGPNGQFGLCGRYRISATQRNHQ